VLFFGVFFFGAYPSTICSFLSDRWVDIISFVAGSGSIFDILQVFLCWAFLYYSSMTSQGPLPQKPIPPMLIPRYLVLFYRYTQGHGNTIRSLHTSIDTGLNMRYLLVTSFKCKMLIRLNIHQRSPTNLFSTSFL